MSPFSFYSRQPSSVSLRISFLCVFNPIHREKSSISETKLNSHLQAVNRVIFLFCFVVVFSNMKVETSKCAAAVLFFFVFLSPGLFFFFFGSIQKHNDTLDCCSSVEKLFTLFEQMCRTIIPFLVQIHTRTHRRPFFKYFST